MVPATLRFLPHTHHAGPELSLQAHNSCRRAGPGDSALPPGTPATFQRKRGRFARAASFTSRSPKEAAPHLPAGGTAGSASLRRPGREQAGMLHEAGAWMALSAGLGFLLLQLRTQPAVLLRGAPRQRALPCSIERLRAKATISDSGTWDPGAASHFPGAGKVFHSGFCSHPARRRQGAELVGDAEGKCFFSSGADAACALRSLWRNGRARWTSNPEVPGSSPGRDGHWRSLFCFQRWAAGLWITFNTPRRFEERTPSLFSPACSPLPLGPAGHRVPLHCPAQLHFHPLLRFPT